MKRQWQYIGWLIIYLVRLFPPFLHRDRGLPFPSHSSPTRSTPSSFPSTPSGASTTSLGETPVSSSGRVVRRRSSKLRMRRSTSLPSLLPSSASTKPSSTSRSTTTRAPRRSRQPVSPSRLASRKELTKAVPTSTATPSTPVKAPGLRWVSSTSLNSRRSRKALATLAEDPVR
jgi:hypothetical protein